MISTIDSPGTGGDSNMQKHGEIDLQNLDYRTLTHEQWELLKRQVIRRAHAERAKVVRRIFAALVSWRQKTVELAFRTRAHPAEQVAIEPGVASQ